MEFGKEYIKTFDTEAQYLAFKASSGYNEPNVSYISGDSTVHYNPYDPYAGHAYVEISGIKWATMNVGATGITDGGLYFQWGDTQGYTAAQVGSGSGQKAFEWADYKYADTTSSPGSTGMTKYNSTDGKTELESSDDAVNAAWGGSWRMPTEADFNALSAATTNAWVTDYQGSGVNGRLFTDKTDSSKTLFFPAAGSCGSGSVYDVGSGGGYWSSSLDTSNVAWGRYLDFISFDCSIYSLNRRLGYSVRGVVG